VSVPVRVPSHHRAGLPGQGGRGLRDEEGTLQEAVPALGSRPPSATAALCAQRGRHAARRLIREGGWRDGATDGPEPAAAPAYHRHVPLTHLACTRCSRRYPPGKIVHTCEDDGAPLFARYDLERAAKNMRPGHLALREPTLWRYDDVLPVDNPDHRVSL